jgi:hypothetical protein
MSDINDLPPDSVSTQQLLMMVRDLRMEQRVMTATIVELRNETNDNLRGVRDEIKTMSVVFEQGKTTIRMMKWLAALAAGAIALYEAVRRVI